MTGIYNIAIIGAGPAGLAAAAEAAGIGLKAVVLDEQQGPGGQIYRAAGRSGLADPGILGREYARGTVLVDDLRRSTAGYVAGATVFDVMPGGWVGFERGGIAEFVRARALVLATGAMERPFPIAGWTLPGVMTAGAAQILLKASGAVPGRATVLAGSGPLLYLLAWQLIRAGQKVQAILDTTERHNYLRALARLPEALRRWDDLAKGLGLIAAIRRAGIAHLTGITELRAEGAPVLTSVSFRRGTREERLETDLLLLHQGVVPNIQLAQALRCDIAWDEHQLCWRPVTDQWGQTSREEIFIAGDGAGIRGAVAAEHAGRIAAIGAACRIGRIGATERDRLAAPHRAALAREEKIRPFLDLLYRPADRFRVPDDDTTIVCRCEEVTAGEVRHSVALGCLGPNQLKAFVRAGMGPCQGRLCGLTVCEAIAKARGVSPATVGYYRLRAPIKPILLGALADMELPDEPGLSADQAGGAETGA